MTLTICKEVFIGLASALILLILGWLSKRFYWWIKATRSNKKLAKQFQTLFAIGLREIELENETPARVAEAICNGMKEKLEKALQKSLALPKSKRDKFILQYFVKMLD